MSNSLGNWSELTLGEALRVKHGFAFKGEYFAESGTYIVLTPGNFYEEGGFRLRPSKERYYTSEIPEDYVLREGDLIIAMTEQAEGLLGSPARIPHGDCFLHNQRLGLIQITDESLLDKDYLYHVFNLKSVRAQIQASASGTKVRHTAPERIYKVKVAVPGIGVQRRISATIKSYDDLIENNRRRIKLLEESARLLYREWFVHLRFPGHEHVKMVDGNPEGWLKTTAFDVMEVLSGGTPKTDVADYWGGGIPFFTPKDATDSPYALDTEKTLTDAGLRKCNSRLYPKDTLFITARGTVGNLNLAQVPMAMNQSCYALVANSPLTQYFLYCALAAAIDQFKARAVGAVFDAIVINTFRQIPFIKPPKDLIMEFHEAVETVFQQIDRLILQSKKLREARDLLLPRLMSGEIEV